jgi:Fibronectin type III domain
MDAAEISAPLDDESAQAQRQRLLRAWTSGQPPDLAVTKPGTGGGLAVGLALGVLVAAFLGVGSAVRQISAEKKKSATAEVAVRDASVSTPITATTVTVPETVTTVTRPAPAAVVPLPVVTSPPVTAPAPPPNTAPSFAFTPPRPALRAANGAVTVSWAAFTVPGGTPLQALRVSLLPSGGAAAINREVAPTHRGTTITSATNGVQYTATLTAVATDGRAGPASAPSEPATPTSTQPSPPARVASLDAKAVNGGITVLWDPPGSDGGSPVQRYQITANPGAKTVEAPWGVRFATLADLASGTAYTITVQAVTEAAYSDPVTTAPVQPGTTGAGRPDAPSAPSVTAKGDGTWTATFTQGASAGGETVKSISFWVVPVPNDGSAGVAVSPTLAPPKSGSATQVVVEGKNLALGVSYTFVVVAWNGQAASLPSAPSGPARVPSTTTTTPRRAATTTTRDEQAHQAHNAPTRATTKEKGPA